MKKFLVSMYLLSVVAFYSFSQSLSLSDASGPVVANSILTHAGTPDSSYMTTHLYVTNVSSEAVVVKCKKDILSKQDSTEVAMCWAGGCFPPSVDVSPTSQSIEPGETFTDFSGDYFSVRSDGLFRSGETVVRWVFFDMDDPNDSVSVIVKYTSYPLGVDDRVVAQAHLSNPSPNPASHHCTFRYSCPAASEGAFAIRNLVGTVVFSQDLSGSAGTVSPDLNFMADGIYFCTLTVDGKTAVTRKLIIRH